MLLLCFLLLSLNICSCFLTNQYSIGTMSQSKHSTTFERSADEHDNTATQPSEAASSVDFARLLGRLKTTPRTGWVRRGVPKWESVADHSWRVAALSLLLPQDFNLQKCIAMGVLHDVAETLTGDICPEDQVSKQEKARMETEAVEKVASLLGQCSSSGEEGGDYSKGTCEQQMLSLLHEYETRESKEAIGVKDLDLLDMIIQADEYEERFDMDLGEFFDGTPVSRFRTPAIQSIAQEVHNQRANRIKARQEEETRNSGNCITESDAAFVAEFSKASSMSSEQVEQVVKAMRAWDKTSKE